MTNKMSDKMKSHPAGMVWCAALLTWYLWTTTLHATADTKPDAQQGEDLGGPDIKPHMDDSWLPQTPATPRGPPSRPKEPTPASACEDLYDYACRDLYPKDHPENYQLMDVNWFELELLYRVFRVKPQPVPKSEHPFIRLMRALFLQCFYDNGRTLPIPPGITDAGMHCLHRIRDDHIEVYYRMAADHLFKGRHHQTIRAKAEMLHEAVRAAVYGQIVNSPMLDNQTRNLVWHKFGSIRAYIGWPDFIFDNYWLSRMYTFDLDSVQENETTAEEDYQRVERQVLTGNASKTFQFAKYFKEMGIFGMLDHMPRQLRAQFEDLKDWRDQAKGDFISGARYNMYDESIFIPIFELAEANFRPEGPAYYNFAMLGRIIGHEYSHAFDIGGGQQPFLYVEPPVDDPNREPMMTNIFQGSIGEKLRKRHSCLHSQIENLHYAWGDHRTDADATELETACDLVGVQAALDALVHYLRRYGPERPVIPDEALVVGEPLWAEYSANQTHQTSDPGLVQAVQRFFLFSAFAYCNYHQHRYGNYLHEWLEGIIHAPHWDRVNLAALNTEAFGIAFDCPLGGSKMNPEKKCPIWS